ncbi:MAG: hypothetical protein ACI8PZ_005853 [Myxococcota bacterium]|jgi:hypothetical protein
MDLSAPLSDFMASGGDQRQVADPATGLTRYRTTLAPRIGIGLGSCTASWPGPRAWHAMERTLERWREAPDALEVVAAEALSVRLRLRAVLELATSGNTVLLPSGTDAIYLVSALAMEGVARVHHVVVGASELGGGTFPASRGMAFSPRVPFPLPGGSPSAGEPVEGLYRRTSATPVYLRGADGECLDIDVVDREVTEVALRAAEDGSRVVVHLVAHSKTGLRAPSVEAMVALRERLGDQLVVLVDAAQGRIAPSDARHAIEMGFMVLWTGSKFYSGPPFSAALLLPERFSADPGALPAGISQWLTAADLPTEWTEARASLRSPANPGLVLRWVGALAETEAYHAIPEDRRSRVYYTFAGAVQEVFGPSHRVVIDLPMAPQHRLAAGLGAFPTVFGFRVHDDDGPLDATRLKRLHALLDTDLSYEGAALGGRFHLGQPVSLGPPGEGVEAVLRVALGARMVTDLAGEDDGGAAWLRLNLQAIRRKTEALIDADLLVDGGSE